MRKKIVRALITVVFVLCFTTLAFAGSTILSFSGGSGFILISTRAPGITIDNFEVSGGESLSAVQQLITSSPTTIIRTGDFSGGGSIRVATETTNPQVQVVAYLASDDSGHLGQSVETGSSASFNLSAQGIGKGDLNIYAYTEEQLDFRFDLMYDAATMNVIASADPFLLNWITQFDSSAQIGGIARSP